jgi:nitroreductase
MDLEEAIYSRRAVREFTAEPVKEEILRQLIDAAIQAPSAVNRQPWLFSVVQDRALLARISTEAKAHMLKTSTAAASHHFQSVLSNADFDIFYHAPALIVISAEAEGPWAVENCALAAENLMLTPCSAGLGSCWISFAQSWLGTPDGKAAPKLSNANVPVAPIIVGHPKTAAAQVPRNTPKIDWIS